MASQKPTEPTSTLKFFRQTHPRLTILLDFNVATTFFRSMALTKNVLIIAYDFPPARTGGVYRPVKFAKYLPEFGWKPIILSVKNYSRTITDDSLLSQLPSDTKIYRAYSFELERLEEWLYKKIFGKNVNSPDVGYGSLHTDKTPKQTDSPPQKTTKKSFASFIKRTVFSPIQKLVFNYLYLPDSKIGWIPFAFFSGMRAIKSEKIDLIFSTSPPESSHVLAFLLSAFSRKPMIVDFRDPWTTHYWRRDKFPKTRQSLERSLEKVVLSRAKSIIHTGSGRAGLVKAEFTDIDSSKHAVITNGYDEGDFADWDPVTVYSQNKSEKLRFLNIGDVYPDSGITQLMDAFKIVCKKFSSAPPINIDFMGNLMESLVSSLSDPEFKGCVNIMGFKKHKEAIYEMLKADVLILVLPEGDIRMRDKIIAGKTFELIRSGRPILMVGYKGESSEIIEKSGLGKFIMCTNTDEIVATFFELLEKKSDDNLYPKPNWEYIRLFDRKYLTKNLADLFNQAVK